MLHQYLRRIFISVVFLFVSTSSLADVVSATISQDTIWSATGNPWIIRAPDVNTPINDISVIGGVTLTIEPGVIVEFDGPIALRVEGTLVAQGLPDNPITFKAFSLTGQWRFIEFWNSAFGSATFSNGVYQSGSILEHVNLESGGGLSFSKNPANGTIFLNNVLPYINNVSITDGDATGIYAADINGELKIHNSTIVNNHDTSGNNPGGIFVQGIAGSNVDIDNNTILNNSTTTTVEGGGGIIIKDVDMLSLTNNSILDNISANVGGGLFLLNLTGVQSNYVVQDNVIGGNITETSGGGIAVQDANVVIRDNLIYDNMTNLNYGAGINIIGNSTVQIVGNAVKNNDAASDGGGIYVNTTDATNIEIINNAVIGNNTSGRGSGVFIDKDMITVTGNIIADNVADGNIAAMEINAGGTVAQNSIVRNQSDSILAFGNPNVGANVLSFTDNNVSQNASTTNAIINAATVMPTITGNNIINNGLGFYLSNTVVGTTLSVNNNWFGTTDQTVLQNNIDGDVDYTAPATAMITDPVPLSPPGNFNIVQNGDSVTMTWDAPPETDLAGFIVYWGNNSAPSYENSLDVGLNQSHTVSGIDTTQNNYFAVTAYDADYATVNDDPTTLINEKQTSGNESWFSGEAVVLGFIPVPDDGGGGGSVAWWSLFLLFALQVFRRYPNHTWQ